MSDHSSTKPVQRNAASSKESRRARIPIKQGDVRRAIRAANTVYVRATNAETHEVDEGVAFMTAVLLVERLATKFSCEPNAVLDRMAECFELKRRYAKMRQCKLQA